ncbi:hypothetical protein [Leptospira sp. GIMC2001]|uniref:hypothetical protein n=1 Tax=Leptospira sp. GIMC2001 TaxID=1513297 RepID=UPI00234B756E|nr:hypothetical protein [Leptospira sp. GIMC2001]WCL48287.1 hypothetical protein O4O04_13340 [Leptospira sp. GIMC2001]
MYKKTYLIYFISFVLIFNSCKQAILQNPTTKKSDIEYRFANGQIFIRLEARTGVQRYPRKIWALLDSGSNQNLAVGLNEPTQFQIAWQDQIQKFDFYPLGSNLPPEYEMILGQPFFRKNCIELEFGIPKQIFDNKNKTCDWGVNEHVQSVQIIHESSQYYVKAKIAEQTLSVALDTGSAITAIPGQKFGHQMSALPQAKRVLDIYGRKQKLIVYKLETNISIGQNEFFPTIVLNSNEIWMEEGEYKPTVGMDFFLTFRIYIDFGSKILGIENHEQFKR